MRTYRIPARGIQNHLTVGLPKQLSYKPMALYSLFKLDAISKRWIRVGPHAYDERTAFYVYRHKIHEAPLSYSIRPIKPNSPQAQSRHHTRFAQVHYNAMKEFAQTIEQEHLDKTVFNK